MHKILKRIVAVFFLAGLLNTAFASADRQSFWGFGPGVEVYNSSGSGTGFYIQGFGGYNFNSMVGMGLHLGYSNVGTVEIRVIDFGAFLQLTEADSGLYGRLYLDGVNAAVSGGNTAHGVAGTQTAFAPGIGLGMLIPSAGDFHFAPELTYRAAFLTDVVNLIVPTVNVTWDF